MPSALDFLDSTSASSFLDEGLKKMWEWAKEQPMREQFICSEYELDKGIYSFWKN